MGGSPVRWMKRRALNLLTILSLGMCVAWGALWAWSYFRSERVSRVWFSDEPEPFYVYAVEAKLTRGNVRVTWGKDFAAVGLGPGPAASADGGGWGWETGEVEDPDTSYRLGFGAGTTNIRSPNTFVQYIYLAFPTWAAVAVSGILPAVRGWRRMRHVPAGHCGGCGYDLTGNESGVCPECGRVVAKGATKQPQ